MGAKDQCSLICRAVEWGYSNWGRNCSCCLEAEANMVITTFLMICSIPQMDQAPKTQTYSAPTEERAKSLVDKAGTPGALVASASLPSAPEPKIQPDAGLVTPITPGEPRAALKPVTQKQRETPRQRKIWYALSAAGHAGAAFDAWSTRRAITSGAGSEMNPMLRPFSHSNTLYAAMQASPFLMDFLGKKMMTSQRGWLRKMWWLPQAAGAGTSFAAGGHNVSVTR